MPAAASTSSGSHNYTGALSGVSFRVGVSDQGGSSTVASQINFSVVAAITSAQTTSSLDLSNDTTLVIAAGGTLTVTDSVEIGSGATLDIESGGTLILSNLVQGTGAATLLLEGGTLEANGEFTSIMPIVIGAGGGTVNTNGYNVTLAGNLSSAASTGTLIKMGAGTLTFSGVNNYTGGTSVQAGALVMASPSAASSSGILTVGPGTLVVLGATTIASPAAANTSTSTAATQTNAETNTTADTATATLTATPTGTATDTTADRTTGAPRHRLRRSAPRNRRSTRTCPAARPPPVPRRWFPTPPRWKASTHSMMLPRQHVLPPWSVRRMDHGDGEHEHQRRRGRRLGGLCSCP